MKFVASIMQIDKDDLKEKYKLVRDGTIMRVRVVQPSDEVQGVGAQAIPVYVINGEKELEQFLDPEDPMDVVVRDDLPPTGYYAIPVYVMPTVVEPVGDEWVEYGGSLQVQSSQTEEAEG